MNLSPYLTSVFLSALTPAQFKDKLMQHIEEPKGFFHHMASEKQYQGFILNDKFVFTGIGVRIEGYIEEAATGSIIKLKFICISTVVRAFTIGLFVLAIIVILTVAYFEGLLRIKFLSALLLFLPTALMCLVIVGILDRSRTFTMKFLNENLKG